MTTPQQEEGNAPAVPQQGQIASPAVPRAAWGWFQGGVHRHLKARGFDADQAVVQKHDGMCIRRHV